MTDFEPSSRRRFLQATGVAGAAATIGLGLPLGPFAPPAAEAQTKAPSPAKEPSPTKVVKNVCHQCPARCGIDVYVTDGRVHAIYGSLDHPIANGKLCPKGHLGTYILYDPDRLTGPMKRTNPKKGRDEDPRFVPITWDEALDTIAGRLNALREKGEPHRFSLVIGRGWGASDAGLAGPFGKLFGSPNIGLGHSSICSDGSKKAKLALDGNYSYNSYDYANTNYILNFGAAFLEAFRPLNNNLQAWGVVRTKSPKTKVTVVDVRLTTTGAAADRNLILRPGTDGALALAIAHVILTEGLWDRKFVGDFIDGRNRFKAGQTVDEASFAERWTSGLIEWWNAELKERTPAWAAKITSIRENEIWTVAREFGSTRPAIALFERGPTTHTNGVYNGMAIHALNALVGSIFAEGGLAYQMSPPYGKLPIKYEDYIDDVAKAATAKNMMRFDKVGSEDWPMASSMIQEMPLNQIKGDPYKLDTIMFYMTNPIFSGLDVKAWEKALAEIFVIDTSPFPGETAMFADIVVPDHTYLERWQDTPTYPFQGYPLANIRVPAIKPIHNTKAFSDTLIEIGKRIKGPMGEYYKKLDNVENVLRHLAKGFEADPGDNGVNGFESWVEKGVWYKKPYRWRQVGGDFFEWDGAAYRTPMTPEQVKAKLLKTPSGKFELKSSYLEHAAKFIAGKLGVARERVAFPQWIEPIYTGAGDLYFITPKTVMHAEGRSANLPQAVALYQPVAGGRNRTYLEMHPETARKRGIGNGDKVRITSDVGSIEAYVRYYPASHPDIVVLPYGFGHWAHGRWAKDRMSGNVNEILPNTSDPISGLAAFYTAKVKVERA